MIATSYGDGHVRTYLDALRPRRDGSEHLPDEEVVLERVMPGEEVVAEPEVVEPSPLCLDWVDERVVAIVLHHERGVKTHLEPRHAEPDLESMNERQGWGRPKDSRSQPVDASPLRDL